ncbi:MAG: hypothetical protein KJ799_02520 [Bacteroidetes bacterium]|nr:hypothetical protein [Bacteroidota bacterium]MBU1677365.1 hypothetical protein [Bacteroidota bacterium]MBU2505586.1 hypothetical protein [Bacteroidota bacterium]
MLYIDDVSQRVEIKIAGIKKLCGSLDAMEYPELRKKLWELEREAALLREFIENNTDEDYSEVI